MNSGFYTPSNMIDLLHTLHTCTESRGGGGGKGEGRRGKGIGEEGGKSGGR